jgi:hypothetical protein
MGMELEVLNGFFGKGANAVEAPRAHADDDVFKG